MTTCDNLTLPGFEPTASTESTPSAAGSPARTSASPARVPAWTVSDPACGERFAVWLASFDPASCSWRTSGLYEGEDSPPFSETLPRSGMTRSGTLYQLPPLVRLTSVTASGSSGSMLPTPTAQDCEQAGGAGCIARGKRGHSLTTAARLLPTPTANEYGSSQNGHRPDGSTFRQAGKPSLSTMARQGLIPTPTAGDAVGSGSRNTPTSKAHPGVSLTDWARGDGGKGRLLPTPQAEDHRNCADYSDRSRGHSPQLRHLGKGRLNPRFVSWMMGFPPNWTDVDGLD